ncbi:tRNA (N(6)-L-threonylcarbamoyladenosine(37)-C(2))-methylthiotransferase MtaB [Slackia heliotrinireducens]|uniref:MiaB-like tRNA modifying enzyme n=1 Tax=Slackia heliotrinireducens (strain ATCC 29202 / DSM 20476 / NCTC 11029 / RHS 1) TaxID=471855 RepID=C7N584_SLAHD|nr:tRNA (N(6)-L-threonylcarbamoyladenosine(37)-C(2))-methylthiotransferase MtaB [Slackia heliotrinireducens]ACV22069.1 MiaB-like tRNA modifying enzyme [Slackia heliotrinireducens DSM 20476]VEH00042.1 (Dimethylallyl)adenosine tRNA methylthiotransferase MiaB [Slackia heliotrinireducens]
MPSTRFHVVNLGCRVNRVESDSFAASLVAHGGESVPVEDADLVIVNTCTVTGEAEKKTRKAVRRVLRENASGTVVVTGCAAAIDPDTYGNMDSRVVVVPKGSMAAYVSHAVSGESPVAVAEGGAVGSLFGDEFRMGEDFPTRVGIKVQDGCNNACTFCIVHVARGRAWSRPYKDVVAEAGEYARRGVREIVLTGINLGAYRTEDADLVRLLDGLLEAAPNTRFRLSSVEPHTLSDDFIGLMAASDGRICRHLHLPLQSGSTKVLKEMARPYTAQDFMGLVDRMYEAVPSLSLSTDVIVGFPGETERDFQDTCDVARACRFSKMHIFRYSMRAGTPAALRSDQISPEVKAERAAKLDAIEHELCAQDLARRKGTCELALVETDGIATTESYHSVAAPVQSQVGDLVPYIF